jgi:hypothetical protein
MTMRTPSRLGALVTLSVPVWAALSVAAPAAPALAAAPSAPKVVQSNWYWYHQADAADGTGAEALPEPSGVPSGDLSVAYTGGTTSDQTQPSKETYLAFDLSGIDPLATVSSFTFTLTLDGPAQIKATPPVLIACAPVRTWSNGEGTSWFDKPVDDCTTAIAAEGKPDAKAGTYTFAIPSLAQKWVAGTNTGVAIRQDPTKQKAPFQLNFKGAATVKASLAYLPPVAAPPAPPTTPQTTPAVSNGGTAPGSLGGTGTTPGLTAPAGTNPAPQNAAPSPMPQVAPQQPVAAVSRVAPAGSMPSVGFWLLGVAVLGFLVLVSLVLGDSSVPIPAGAVRTSRRVSRLDQVLRSRRPSFTLEPR